LPDSTLAGQEHDRTIPLADIVLPFRRIGSLADGAYHFVIIIVVIRHETTAAARWALLLIVSTLFNNAITVAVRTGFHRAPPLYAQ
jgi:hypothetical protein